MITKEAISKVATNIKNNQILNILLHRVIICLDIPCFCFLLNNKILKKVSILIITV